MESLKEIIAIGLQSLVIAAIIYGHLLLFREYLRIFRKEEEK